jgi:phospholipid-binding lipoprotein MlaA
MRGCHLRASLKRCFGQTPGRYGLGNGPYLVLPVFGPSNLRDGVGLAGDFVINSYTDPVNLLTDDEYSTPYAILEAIDTRAATAFRYYGSGSPSGSVPSGFRRTWIGPRS